MDPHHPPVTLSPCGFVQTQQMAYKLNHEYGCRVPCKAKTADIVRTVKFHLPMCMNPQNWIRHEMTMDDVLHTLENLQAFFLWHLALLFGIIPPASAIQDSCASPTAVTYARASTLKKLEEEIQYRYGTELARHERSVFERTTQTHDPPLPVHAIPLTEFQQLTRLIPPCTQNLLQIIHIKAHYEWKEGTLWIPFDMEQGMLHMIRIVPFDIYLNSGRPQEAMCQRPLRFMINNELYAGTEEACFFTT